MHPTQAININAASALAEVHLLFNWLGLDMQVFWWSMVVQPPLSNTLSQVVSILEQLVPRRRTAKACKVRIYWKQSWTLTYNSAC
jgi:hypothetical protein